MRKSVTFKIDADLLAQVDKARGGQTRTEWLEDAVKERLDDRKPAPRKHSAGLRPGSPSPSLERFRS